MAQAHYVVIPDEDGTAAKYPLKQWLRENPLENPPGMHPDENTSHALRSGLKKRGWKLQFTPTEVLIVKPDAGGNTSFADELVEAANIEDSQDLPDDFEDSTEVTFRLERDLQSALRSDIGQLERGLSIIDGGTEYSTAAGRIDILSTDDKGRTVVIELKAGRAGPKVIAQTLAYMTTVAAEKGPPVRGIIVAGDFDERVILASRAVPNLELKRYAYQFRFDTV